MHTNRKLHIGGLMQTYKDKICHRTLYCYIVYRFVVTNLDYQPTTFSLTWNVVF